MNHAEPGTMLNPSGVTPYRPYGGVRECASEFVGEARIIAGLPPGDSFRRDIDSLNAARCVAGTVFINLPLSLIGDTILFPVDVVDTLRGRGEPPEGGWPLLRARAQTASMRIAEAEARNAPSALAESSAERASGGSFLGANEQPQLPDK